MQEFWEEEQKKLEKDVREKGLSLAVFADWYNVGIMKEVRFFDQNTQQHWMPVTGGSHLPALNEFLETFGIAFTTQVVHGEWGSCAVRGVALFFLVLMSFPRRAHHA